MSRNYNDHTYIDGEMFGILIRSGAVRLKQNIQRINDLNVFPIPDGDTGDNMYLTLSGGIREMDQEKNTSIGRRARALAGGMLLAARGNSGVILSQIFAGIADGLEEKDRVSLTELTEALDSGVSRAYEKVLTPVEGTILTVARETAQALHFTDEETTLGEYTDHMIRAMHDSLENTPELLDVLKEAGVVDSGGAGLYMIAEGMAEAVHGDAAEGTVEPAATTGQMPNLELFTEDSILEFGYCTEFLLRLTRSKVDVDGFDEQVIIDYLSTIGDSIVAFKDGSIVKVHVHTMTPSRAMEFCQQFGEFLTVKVENMMLQHNHHMEQLEKKRGNHDQDDNNSDDGAVIPTVKKKRRHYGTCVVSSGKGIQEVFRELGADEILEGGQTKNPSIQEFLDCFDRLNADVVFVFPNNSNIFLAARQAAEMYHDSDIRVIPSRDPGQAYTAMSMLDISFDDPDQVEQNFISNMEYAATGMVCRVCRDYQNDELTVSDDGYLGIAGQKPVCASQDKVMALKDLCEKLGISEREIVTVIFGEDNTDEDREKVRGLFREEWPDKEFYEIDGQQDVYDLIVILE